MLVCWQRSLVLPDFTVFDYPTTHEFEHSWNNTQLDETISDGAFISNCSVLKFMFSRATKIDEIFTVDLTLCSKCQIDGEDFVNFCGLLRKHEL